MIPLGDGPLATVYAQQDARTGADVAVKVYRAPLDPDTHRELAAEQEKLAGLRHLPSILAPGGVRRLPDGRSAVESPRGTQSLAQLVDTVGALSADEVLAIGESLAGALAAAHRAGIVHGGVHPHNVLFRETGEPALADFGVAVRQPAGPPSGDQISFAAPETLRDGTRSPRADLYGLGAVLHFALAAEAPHPRGVGEPDAEQILRVLSTPAPKLQRPDVPPELSGLLTALLAADPGQRPADAATVAARLTELIAQPTAPEPAQAAETAPPVRQPAAPVAVFTPEAARAAERRRKGRRSGLIAAGVIAVGAAGVGLGVLVLGGNDAPPRAQGSDPLSSQAPAPTTTPPAEPEKLELLPPDDQKTYVDLSWRGPSDIDYFVEVAAADRPDSDSMPAGRKHTYRVRVDPTVAYCFRVQATDGDVRYESDPVPIREARCST